MLKKEQVNYPNQVKDDSTALKTYNKLQSLTEYIKQQATQRRGRSIPPLNEWHPEREGEIDLVIKANGEWWYEGRKITRQSLIDLFATVLWMEKDADGRAFYYLKTPIEKLSFNVEDAPFLITEVNIIDDNTNSNDANNSNVNNSKVVYTNNEDTNNEDKRLSNSVIEFITITGDSVILNANHPIKMRDYKGEQRPYIEVRFGMYGLLSRAVLMHLIKIGELSAKNDLTTLTLISGGKPYCLTVNS